MSLMNAEFFKPFVDGTLETLRIQCATEARPGKPFIRPDTTVGGKMDPAIAAVIGVTSDGFRATVTLCFPEPSFLKIMTNMLGEPCSSITKDLEDGVAELLNIIFGAAKRVINQQHGGAIQMAIPTIIRGGGIQATALTRGRTVVLPFVLPGGDEFQIQVSMDHGLEREGASK